MRSMKYQRPLNGLLMTAGEDALTNIQAVGVGLGGSASDRSRLAQLTTFKLSGFAGEACFPLVPLAGGGRGRGGSGRRPRQRAALGEIDGNVPTASRRSGIGSGKTRSAASPGQLNAAQTARPARGTSKPSSESRSTAAAKERPPPMMLCKVLVVGNAKCGKTSLIRRFSKDSFDSNYDTTVGVDFVRKDLEVSFPEQGRGGKAGGCECSSSAANVRMQLWDIAGQDRFAKLTRAYFRRAKAAAIVCDLTRKGTFEAVRQWKHEIDTWAGSGSEGGGAAGDNSAFAEDGRRDRRKLPVVLFANKSDLLEDTTASFLAGARMESVCRELGIVAWFVTSAKDGVNVEQGFRHLATLVAAKELGLDQDSAAASLTTPSSLSSTAAPTSPSSSQLFDRSRPWSVRKNKAHAAPTEAEEAGSEDDSSGDEEMSALLLGGDSLLTVWDLDDF